MLGAFEYSPSDTIATSADPSGDVQLPPNITGLQVRGGGTEWGTRDCEIEWTEADWPALKDYRIQVRKTDDTLLRTEYTTEPFYVYSWDKNNYDNSGSPLRQIKFQVYCRDIFGRYSSSAATITASNTAPDMGSFTPTVTGIYNGLKIDWSALTIGDMDLLKFEVLLDQNNPPTTIIGTVDSETDVFFAMKLDTDKTYYVKIRPHDIFGVGTDSLVASGSPTTIPAINIAEELRGNLKMSDYDGNSEATLAKLYDGNKTSDGISYTASGWLKWVQYRFPVEYIVDRIILWPSVAINCYIAYSDDGSTWNYLKAEADHTLDADGKLLVASSESDAQTNYWTTSSGKAKAIFPDGIKGRYFRLYMGTTHTLYELIFFREIIAEFIAANSITANEMAANTITANEIKGSAFGTLEITSGKIKINTTDALEIAASGNIKVLAGGDIILVGDDSSPGAIVFDGSTLDWEMTTSANGFTLFLLPLTNNTGTIWLGDSSKQQPEYIYMDAKTRVQMEAYYSVTENQAVVRVDSGSPQAYIRVNAGGTENATLYVFTGYISYIVGAGVSAPRIDPGAHFTIRGYNIGQASKAWDEGYADNWNNVADFYIMGRRKEKNGSIVEFSDIDVIRSIAGKGIYDERTGFEIIDDNSIPDWLKVKHKIDSDIYDENHNVVGTQRKGEIAYDPDGRPYLSLKTVISLFMGAIRELDERTRADKAAN